MAAIEAAKRTVRAGLAILIACAACGRAGAAQFDMRFAIERYQGGFESTDDVGMTRIPLDLSFGKHFSRFTITVPYLRINHSGNVVMTADGPAVLGIGGPGRPPFQTSDPGDGQEGLGDVILRDESLLLSGGRGKSPALAITFDLKLPTADETKGLGTGERDWGVGLEFVQPLSVHWRMLANATRRFMKSPEGLDFRNRWLTGLGLEGVTTNALYRFTLDNQTPLLSEVPVYDANGAAVGVRKVDDRLVAGFDWVRNRRGGGSTLVGVWTGLSDDSEDLGFTLSWSSTAQ